MLCKWQGWIIHFLHKRKRLSVTAYLHPSAIPLKPPICYCLPSISQNSSDWLRHEVQKISEGVLWCQAPTCEQQIIKVWRRGLHGSDLLYHRCLTGLIIEEFDGHINTLNSLSSSSNRSLAIFGVAGISTLLKEATAIKAIVILEGLKWPAAMFR